MPSDRSDGEYEMFTVRVNIEKPTERLPGSAPPVSEGRLKIHVRHVNSGEETTRFSLDEAVGWLRGKVASLFQNRGGPVRPSKSSDPAQQ